MIGYGLLLVAGFIGLWYSAETTVEGAEVLIHRLGISSFTFGAVFISISTGLPEIATALISTHQGVPGLSAGDIIGSSFVNLSLVLGVTILASRKLEFGGSERRLVRISTATIMLSVLALLAIGELNVFTTLFLIVIYSIFLYSFKPYMQMNAESSSEVKFKAVKTVLGVLGLLISARVMVFSAVSIGEIFQIPLEVLGATVIAVGTGLPELAFEVTSVRKGDLTLALGDIFGSTVVNLTLVLGLLGLISTPALESLFITLGIVSITSIASLGLLYKGVIARKSGYLLLTLFSCFTFIQLALI